jgi:AraC-like DNA-binding protein
VTLPTSEGATLAALVDRWRTDAETLRRRGAVAQADAAETFARDLEEALEAHRLETLDVHEAARESGYSESQLRRIFKGRPITRAALPRKPAA